MYIQPDKEESLKKVSKSEVDERQARNPYSPNPKPQTLNP